MIRHIFGIAAAALLLAVTPAAQAATYWLGGDYHITSGRGGSLPLSGPFSGELIVSDTYNRLNASFSDFLITGGFLEFGDPTGPHVTVPLTEYGNSDVNENPGGFQFAGEQPGYFATFDLYQHIADLSSPASFPAWTSFSEAVVINAFSSPLYSYLERGRAIVGLHAESGRPVTTGCHDYPSEAISPPHGPGRLSSAGRAALL